MNKEPTPRLTISNKIWVSVNGGLSRVWCYSDQIHDRIWTNVRVHVDNRVQRRVMRPIMEAGRNYAR